MLPSKLRATVVVERLSWIERMLTGIRGLPLERMEDFTADPHNPAAAESYLRRCLESLFDLGRHILAKGFGRAPAEYRLIGSELQQVGVLSRGELYCSNMAGYGNRMVHLGYIRITQLHSNVPHYTSSITDVPHYRKSKESKMGNSRIDKVIEEFTRLPAEDREYVAEIMRKQLIELRRDRISQRAREARMNLEKGTVKTGTAKDLMEDLDSD